MNSEDEFTDDDDFERTKVLRQKRFSNKNKRDKRQEHQERRIKPLRIKRPRTKIHYDPDFDYEDDDKY